MREVYFFDYLYLSVYKLNKFINISLINSTDVETSVFLSFLYGTFFSIKIVSLYSIDKKLSLFLLLIFALLIYKFFSLRYHKINYKKLNKQYNYIYFFLALFTNAWILIDTYKTIVNIK